MKKLLSTAVALLLIHTFSFGQKLPADSIFANYYKATGGKELWDGVKSYALKRNYASASAAPFEANVSVSIPDQSMYKSKVIMRRNFEYGVKPDGGWIKVPIGNKIDVKDLSQAEQENMRTEIYENLAAFIDYQKRGFIATTVGTEAVNGVTTNHVEMQGKGIKYNLYFDAATGLLVRQRETVGGIETVSTYSNYVKSPYGISYPTKIVQVNSSDKKPVTVTSSLTVNQTIAPEVFKR
ncbi:hypothetical protein DSL64_18855 [Dyadobacter luteus]|uniref:Outer membrane lipoprotein-sorting protein n=1 Tax=Dyadobacter luteus TaxID=2259619 RepID=A0A3D8Y7L5_9BACT|nr:hypothetical protein [Dyadobacter luteus]REA59021.1 hypothetical protein DSL64_18855 [Dyadobacter luteus]